MLGRRKGAHGHGMIRMEPVEGLIGRQELIDLLLFDQFDRLDHMAQDEPVHIDDHREEAPS